MAIKGDTLRQRISFGFFPEVEGITLVPISPECHQKIDEFETCCFWCDMPIVLFIQEKASKLIPVCCSRCKSYFWF